MNVADRFLKYVSIDTKSDPDSGKTPSSEGQSLLANELALELDLLGLEEVTVSEYGCVYGVLPASEGCGQTESVGLIAHMDTSPDCPGAGVKPRIVEYAGGDIVLDASEDIVLRESEHPALGKYAGQHIVVTDGHTLLGADDKAGVAEIITALERLSGGSIKHGRVPVCFTPDEEIGEGADHFDIERFAADYAYTVDGGALGELEYENFNAAMAKIRIRGVNIHPGEAKNKMKNAILIAAELAGMLPPDQTPAKTEGYEGFYHLCRMCGDEEHAEMKYIIRDHNREIFGSRKDTIKAISDKMNEKYGEGTVLLELSDTYYNMRELFEGSMHIIDRAAAAMREEGVEPDIRPIRGGTDGAMLSYKGLLCPNLSTGGHNFHGRFEFIPVESMEKMTDILVRLLTVKN